MSPSRGKSFDSVTAHTFCTNFTCCILPITWVAALRNDTKKFVLVYSKLVFRVFSLLVLFLSYMYFDCSGDDTIINKKTGVQVKAVVLKLCVVTPRCIVSIFQRRRGIFWFCAIKSRFYCVKRTLIVDSFLTFF